MRQDIRKNADEEAAVTETIGLIDVKKCNKCMVILHNCSITKI